jgi:CheY-like chemotaxis protein
VVTTGKKILIVDDSEIILEAARDALGRAGHTVVTASTPAELVERAEHHAYDLVLMDVQMPELFGDDIATVLRDRGMTGKIYLFSSLPVRELEMRTRDAQLDGFISKDVGLDAMVVRVGEIVGS